jgi:GAF domain-containing protein/anti-sigma regulatory factor (Ser/Thr protein kinase)
VRYVVALAASAAGILVTQAIFESRVSDEPIYAPLIAVVALTSWYGGLGPAAVSIAICWLSALFFLHEPRGTLRFDDGDDLVAWWINLAAVIVIAAIGGLLRIRGERSALERDMARSDVREVRSLQELTIALASAVSSADVVRAVASHSRPVVGASAFALGLVDGQELDVVVAEPASDWSAARRLPLSEEALVTEAARTGSIAIAEDRAGLVHSYPGSAAAWPPSVERGLAVPLRAEGTVVGSVGYLFDGATELDGDTLALARIVADLTGQALERARLYESERESRVALDRILQVAPRFLGEDRDQVVEVICREARSTFGADYGVLWRIREGGLDLLAMDPPRPDIAADRLSLDDFPRLHEAIDGLGASFITDVLHTTYGEGLRFVTELGIRSSLRTPIVIAGSSELVLAISWEMVVSEPDPATIAVFRRFADQAGLALEQVERREAEAVASRRAEEVRRLQEVTGRLSVASTVLEVSTTCLEKALESLGAEAGFVVVAGPEGTRAVEIVTSTGYDDAELEAWSAHDLDSDVPFARAIATGEPVWALSEEQMSTFGGLREERAGGWITIPLVTRGRERAALHVSLRASRDVTEDERAWLQSMVSQCGQALERASQYEAEQTIAETLQRSVLPSSLPRVEGVELAARYLPGSAQLDVGGDWFDALQLPDGKLGLVVGDVVGKGVQAAASMAQLRNAIRAFSVDRLKPSSVLVRLNRLADEVLDTSFATLAYLALEPETGMCRLSSAGHPPPVVACPDGRVELVERARGLPLGTGLRTTYRQELLELPAGSVLVLYTDGLVERRGRSIDEGLDALLRATSSGPKDPDRLLEHILEHVVGDEERGDDIALLAVRIMPVAPRPLHLRLRSDLGSMDTLRDGMRSWLRGVDLPRSDVEDLVLATWEACANAIEHALEPAEGVVVVRAAVDDGRVTVTVGDSGRWAPPIQRDDRGLGLRLMEALVTSVAVAESPSGTTVTLEKDLRPAEPAAP